MIPRSLLTLLETPLFRGEVRLAQEAPQKVGFRLFFPHRNDLREAVGQLQGPVSILEHSSRLTAEFDLVPGHWLRLGLNRGRLERFALNYEIPIHNYYPISTLRVFLRRYGCRPPAQLEKSLAPALERKDSRWGITLDLSSQTPRPSLFGRIPRELLGEIGHALAGSDFLSTWEETQKHSGSPWCYISLNPDLPQSLGVDLEDIPLAHLELPLPHWPALSEPLLCPYAKCRAKNWAAYLPWPAFAAWWKPEHSRAAAPAPQYLEEVIGYYDRCQADYLEHLGPTWQAGRLGKESAQSSNQQLAQRARIGPGMQILDAGCGVAGPALDIARAHPTVAIEALTLCAAQVEQARQNIRDERVRVTQGDFHNLPYEDDTFDRVLYLESSGYAYHRARLFGEAHRVLRPDGMIYIKDVFRLPGPLRTGQWLDLDRFDRLYAQRTPTLEETLECLQQTGFRVLVAESLDSLVSMTHYHQAMGAAHNPTSFGFAHGQDFRDLPLFFAEVLAQRVDG